MRFTQGTTYKHCNNYIAHFLSFDYLKNTRIWTAFKEVGESESKAKEALTAGQGPLVWIKDLPAVCGVYKGRSGGDKSIVFVDKCVADGYEHGTNWKSWEATVLHELVHWVRFVANKPSRFQGGEAGNAFEVKAYGSVQPCTSTCGST